MSNNTEASALVLHLKNVIMSDICLIDYLSESTRLYNEQTNPEARQMLKLIRHSQLVLILSAVIGQIGVTDNQT